jgi:subtilisin family serine protease
MKPRVRVAVIDSGVHAAHPHILGVAGGVAIMRDASEGSDYTDRIGHGTAVAAVIREKAPEAEIFAVKIFHDRLATRIETLLQAIEWCVTNQMHLINLSVGTGNPDHGPQLQAAVKHIREHGIALVSAYEDGGVHWLPGCLHPEVGQAHPPAKISPPPGLLPVALDWDCRRDQYRTSQLPDGRILFHASGFPRPIPGVPPERNLKGISFAVANVTGILARQMASL